MIILCEKSIGQNGLKSHVNGVLTIKSSEKNGTLAKIVAVNGDEDALIVTNLGIIIRTSLKQVNVSGRNTLGVRIIKLAENQIVSSLCVTDPIEEETEEENTTNQENSTTNTVEENSENKETN